MDVQFFIQEGVQVVSIRGNLKQIEGAAVRVTLEKKINVGRTKVLFDLNGFPIQDDTNREVFFVILNYALNRASETACSGIRPSLWPLLLKAGPRKPKFYVSKDEALYYMTHKPAVAEEPKKEGEGGDNDESMKKEALQELLDSYDIFQYSDDDDPLRLGFYTQRLKENPQFVDPHIEMTAKVTLESMEGEIKSLNTEVETLAEQLKGLILARKLPSNETEIQNKLDALQLIADTKTAENHVIEKKIQEIETFLENQKKEMEKTKKNTEKDEQDMESKANSLTAEVASLEAELKK